MGQDDSALVFGSAKCALGGLRWFWVILHLLLVVLELF